MALKIIYSRKQSNEMIEKVAKLGVNFQIDEFTVKARQIQEVLDAIKGEVEKFYGGVFQYKFEKMSVNQRLRLHIVKTLERDSIQKRLDAVETEIGILKDDACKHCLKFRHIWFAMTGAGKRVKNIEKNLMTIKELRHGLLGQQKRLDRSYDEYNSKIVRDYD